MTAKEHAAQPVYLCYLDESGNTGMNLGDPRQPVFVLGSLIVPASNWRSIEAEQRDPGTLRHDRIIEKCFFIDSTKSLLLQLCDMCAYYARKKEEQKLNCPIRERHQAGIDLLEPLILKKQEPLLEIIEWMDEQIKKRPGE